MVVKQPPVGQVQGRGQRIKSTEDHFNMQCLDSNGVTDTVKLASTRIVTGMGVPLTMEEYAQQFDGVTGHGDDR